MPTATERRPPIGRRELGRATLARQLLLERAPLGVVEAIERLMALQAQEPRPPFVGLWSRLAGFEPQRLRDLMLAGDVVRGPLFRGTLHLVSAADWSAFRGPCQPALEAAARRLGERVAGMDMGAVAATARTLLTERPRTAEELRGLLHEAHPQHDERALGYVVRMSVPMTLLATDDRWGYPRDAELRLADPAIDHQSPEGLVRRYLSAYGPASVADAQEWSGLASLGAAFEALRDELVTFADERGRELFDLPDAPRPDPRTPAPVRFLPEFDSLMLAHSDRSRLIADAHRPRLTTTNLRVNATVLVDGEVRATWSVKRRASSATLEVTPFERLPTSVVAAITQEGDSLLRATEPAAGAVEVTVAQTEPSR